MEPGIELNQRQADSRASFAVRGRLVIGGQVVDGALVVEDGRIAEIRRGARASGLPARVYVAAIVAPGLIDLQVNGGFGKEVGVDADAIPHLSRMLTTTGVTAFLPTLISSPASAYPALFESFAAVQEMDGARPLGLHLEGPFLSPARRGAHPTEAIEGGDETLFASLLVSGAVSLMTLASEREGGLDRVRRLVQAGIVVSLGHTDATYDEVRAGADAGATMATHLYNAMSPFGHREPGAIGAILVEDRLTVGLIADGVHVHPAAIDLALRAKGLDRIALVSDMISAAGLPAAVTGGGGYSLGGRSVMVDETSVRLADGTLAGSILTMDRAIRNLVNWELLSPAAAIKIATEVPARVLSLPDAGALTVGARADLALFSEALTVTHTFVGGQLVYPR